MAGTRTESVYTIPITPFDKPSEPTPAMTNENTPQEEPSTLSVSTNSAQSSQATESGGIDTATSEASLDNQNLDPCVGNPDTIICQTSTLEIGETIGNLIQFIFIIAVILALGFLVYGGIKWLTSGGDKENVAKARGTIIAAIIGLIIVFLSYAILNLVLNFLIGTGISDIQIPTMTQIIN